jgi:hypothetical protein
MVQNFHSLPRRLGKGVEGTSKSLGIFGSRRRFMRSLASRGQPDVTEGLLLMP